MNTSKIQFLNTTISYLITFVMMIMVSCMTDQKTKIRTSQNVATSWADMSVYIAKNTPANSPTFASRGFGYIGLTMYESIVQGYPTHNTLAGQLNGLDKLPTPEANAEYDWVLSLNAGQAFILKNIYNQTADVNKHKIDSLEEVIYTQFAEVSKSKDVVDRSVQYGRAVASAIFEWSKADGGHRGYLHNFDKKILAPSKPGSWEPPLYGQSFSHYPLHPHWGENRTFLKVNSELPTPQMIPYDTAKQSEYYKQIMSVYKKNISVTQEEKEASLWWADDPGDTFTPPGHSYYLATLVIKKQNSELIKCAETYARVGMATADAFINCWKWKYHFWSERPSSFIAKNIDERWESFWPDPPFPAFPSGHATQAAATASVLIDLYGDKINLIDSAHALRPRDELRNVDFKPRVFSSFWQIAEETADSRFYGGIHSPQDNEVGLIEGEKMGKNVNALNWYNETQRQSSSN